MFLEAYPLNNIKDPTQNGKRHKSNEIKETNKTKLN